MLCFVDVSVPPPTMWTDLGTLLIFHVFLLTISFLEGQCRVFYVSLYVCISSVKAFWVYILNVAVSVENSSRYLLAREPDG